MGNYAGERPSPFEKPSFSTDDRVPLSKGELKKNKPKKKNLESIAPTPRYEKKVKQERQAEAETLLQRQKAVEVESTLTAQEN